MEEMDLDQQLEYEMLRSQKLKQNLIEVLEVGSPSKEKIYIYF